MPGNLLRVLEGPTVRQIRRDARRPERVAARGQRQSGGQDPTLDHRQDDTPRQGPPGQLTRPIDTLKQRRFRVPDGGGAEIRREGVLGAMMGRHVVPLPALFVEPQPASWSLRKIVLPLHADDRAHPSEAEDHHADQRPIAEPDDRPRVDLIGTLRREFLDHVLFWNASDLERTLVDFAGYYKWESQCVTSLCV